MPHKFSLAGRGRDTTKQGQATQKNKDMENGANESRKQRPHETKQEEEKRAARPPPEPNRKIATDQKT